MKVVPRQPGDTSPALPPIAAEALRKAGRDPAMFVLAPGESGAVAPGIGLPPAGGSLEHRFLFTDRGDALRTVDTFVDRKRPVTIVKDEQGWWVTINGAAEPGVSDDDEHRRVAAEVVALGGQDRGIGRMTVTTKIHVK
jgi:hypothetical protein